MQPSLLTVIESLLFICAKPLSLRDLAKYTETDLGQVEATVAELKKVRNIPESGVHLLEIDGLVQLVTNPACAAVVESATKEEIPPELTRPALEALTIIAYRGPVTKPDIEAIRGVNCSLILRNLLTRGLIEEREDAQRMQPVYTLSVDALRHLGLHDITELPDYGVLHGNAQIDKLLAALVASNQGQDAV